VKFGKFSLPGLKIEVQIWGKHELTEMKNWLKFTIVLWTFDWDKTKKNAQNCMKHKIEECRIKVFLNYCKVVHVCLIVLYECMNDCVCMYTMLMLFFIFCIIVYRKI
jgi:hypothetical protein